MGWICGFRYPTFKSYCNSIYCILHLCFHDQGMLIQTSYKGVHVVGGVKFQSPAHQCGKIEEGDEVVQVNYQTVVGWQQKKLKAAMLENSTKVILTLKKRPRHSNNFGQIYVKPYRLPSKKRESYNFRWQLNDGQAKSTEIQPVKPDLITNTLNYILLVI